MGWTPESVRGLLQVVPLEESSGWPEGYPWPVEGKVKAWGRRIDRAFRAFRMRSFCLEVVKVYLGDGRKVPFSWIQGKKGRSWACSRLKFAPGATIFPRCIVNPLPWEVISEGAAIHLHIGH